MEGFQISSASVVVAQLNDTLMACLNAISGAPIAMQVSCSNKDTIPSSIYFRSRQICEYIKQENKDL